MSSSNIEALKKVTAQSGAASYHGLVALRSSSRSHTLSQFQKDSRRRVKLHCGVDFLRSKGIPVPRVYALVLPRRKRSGNLPQNLQTDLYAAGVEDKDGNARRFCIGPTAEYMFWRGKRAQLELNRGPCEPLLCSDANTMLEGEVAPAIYVDLLDKYLSICPYLLPGDHAHSMNQPTMRHPGLWIIGPEEKSQADELYRRQMLFYLYMIFNAKDNKPHFNALSYPMLMLTQHLLDRPGRPWSGNVVTLKGALLRVINSWDTLMSTRLQKAPCPVRFDPDNEKDFYQFEENWFKSNLLVEHWRSLLDDVGQDGWVRNESFERVVEVNKQLKKHWIDKGEDEEDVLCVEHFWPFQDHEETD
ncbi:phosphotransferase enzyme family protein [Blastomyces gilchristii SLH14081]|uniref:Phosphotransferase enzyme family protein n=1 Tax=Blastomyces gilchristii (strain SLH14081) TaxID=559298 RepID=A0A179UQW9_BLAGS|nr:phosphotransferase enzyme family protein [Blastomyces gilchristii SLH14081]OAT10193.1 phosphotransferase enzyme family protein [Blastomyces gilchristii SLH14081]